MRLSSSLLVGLGDPRGGLGNADWKVLGMGRGLSGRGGRLVGLGEPGGGLDDMG